MDFLRALHKGNKLQHDKIVLNAMFTKLNFNVNEVDMKWNRFPCHDEIYRNQQRVVQ